MVFGLELGRFGGTIIKACFINGGDYEKIYEKFLPLFEGKYFFPVSKNYAILSILMEL
jgi:hypothetical protein